jgi:hypothetical protein
MYDCGIMATTLYRRPPDIVAVPVGKQHWCKQKVQCSRLSGTAYCVSQSVEGESPELRSLYTQAIRKLVLARERCNVRLWNCGYHSVPQATNTVAMHYGANTTNRHKTALGQAQSPVPVGYLVLLRAKTLSFQKASRDRRCSTEASTCAAGCPLCACA